MGALTKKEVYQDEYLELMVLRGAIYSIERHLREDEILNKSVILSILDFTKEEVDRVKEPRKAIYKIMEGKMPEQIENRMVVDSEWIWLEKEEVEEIEEEEDI